jgi:hypothetical protein
MNPKRSTHWNRRPALGDEVIHGLPQRYVYIHAGIQDRGSLAAEY